MDYHGALGVLRTVIKERPDAILVNEGANTLDLDARRHRHVQAAQAARCRHLGRHGHRHGPVRSPPPSRPASRCWRSRATSAFGFSGMEVETICRYNLPVCIVVFNNDGIYRGTDVNKAAAPIRRRPCS